MALAACLTSAVTMCSGGCASSSAGLAQLNPFSKSSETVANTAPAAPTPGTLASTQQAVTGQFNSLSAATSSAWTKTKNGVTGLLGMNQAPSDEELQPGDPTRLNTPASVSPEVFVAQGALWETTGDFDKALASYQRALDTEPDNAAALASMGRLHLRQNRPQEAAELLEKAIQVTPQDASLHNDFGSARARMGDVDGAGRAVSQALDIAPGTSRFANNLANIRFEAGDPQGAMAVLAEHNKPAVAHYNMAYLHFQAGDFAAAKSELSEVLKYEPVAEDDSAVGQAIARSREMLSRIDGQANRVVQAGSRALDSANRVANILGAQPNSQQASPGSEQRWNPAALVPQSSDAPTGPTQPPQGQAPPQGEAPQAGTGGTFNLPSGAFDQPTH